MKTTKGIIILLSIVFTMSMPNCGMAKKNVSPITIGCIVSGEGNVDATFKNLQEMGFTSCQIGFPGDRSGATIDKLISARRKYGIKITTAGKRSWRFTASASISVRKPGFQPCTPTSGSYQRIRVRSSTRGLSLS